MDSLELERRIQDELRRIHAAKIAGQLPLVDCLREVVHVAAKLAGDENRVFLASQVARKVAVEYGWAMTLIERSTVKMMLSTYAAQWAEEALSGEAESPVGLDARRRLELLNDLDGQVPKYVTVSKAAKYGRVTARRIEQLVTDSKLRAVGGKGHRTVSVSDLISYYPPEK
jgi:hypothetical protein